MMLAGAVALAGAMSLAGIEGDSHLEELRAKRAHESAEFEEWLKTVETPEETQIRLSEEILEELRRSR
tara:strand:+ start:466 stop:669 length:204 start_codon:yes stop_codon:yes gene_type:complete